MPTADQDPDKWRYVVCERCNGTGGWYLQELFPENWDDYEPDSFLPCDACKGKGGERLGTPPESWLQG